VIATGDSVFVSRAAYNLGEARYRLGADAEAKDPKAAIASYDQALEAYKRAMTADPKDDDARFNHEFVAAKLAALKKHLEDEEKKRKEEEEKQKSQDEGGPEQPNPESSAEQPNKTPESSQGEPDQGPGAQQQPQQPPAPEQPSEEPQGQSAEPGAEAGGEGAESAPDRRSARAVLDTARSEELSPGDIRRGEVAGEAEPQQDW
jgi:Ca-activated chloride channel family protein